MNHGSLFSGIGGFDLAAARVGWHNVFQVEVDKKAQAVLRKNFKDTNIYDDITTFDGTEYAGAIDIVSGGFPCQPFSNAGKRKGSADSRFLWDEMYRVISEIKPRWVVAENVSGLISIESGLVFERVCASLEGEGYAVQSFIIPACSVGAPHKRNRVWIIAHQNADGGANGEPEAKRGQKPHRHAGTTDEIRTSTYVGREQTRDEGKRFTGQCQNRQTSQERTVSRYGLANSNKNSPHTIGGGLQTIVPGRILKFATPAPGRDLQPFWRRTWFEVATELCRMDDGVPGRLDRLKQLGNAIVPQVAECIFRAINEYEGIEI